MAHSHVPKFGNWDRENVQYTAFFENARKGRGVGTKIIINPNDPEQNPDALMHERYHHHNHKHEEKKQHHHHFENYNNNNSSTSTGNVRRTGAAVHAPPPPLITSDDKEKPVAAINVQRIRKDKIRNYSEASGDGSSSGHSSAVQSHQSYSHARSEDSRHDFPPSFSPQPQWQKAGDKNRRVETHRRAASVPKFGIWDETNLKSGEGFTVIFDKVKEERQINAAAQFPNVSIEPNVYSNGDKISRSVSSKSKMWCCLLPMASG